LIHGIYEVLAWGKTIEECAEEALTLYQRKDQMIMSMLKPPGVPWAASHLLFSSKRGRTGDPDLLPVKVGAVSVKRGSIPCKRV